MGPTVKELESLLDAYQYCALECDGLSKVFTTLLHEQAIAHTVYMGALTHRASGASQVHVWIELETGEGWRTIDYRARYWLGESEEVPHGIFRQDDYQAVAYTGEPGQLAPLSAAHFAFFTMPIPQLLESLSLPSPVLYTVGYRQFYAEATLRFLVSRGFPVADIRERAGSRWNAAYNRARLAARFPGMYYRIPELGNVNHNTPGAPIEFKDLEAGMHRSQQLLLEEAAGRGAVYLCACAAWECCHSTQAAKHLQERVPGLTIVHLQIDGTLAVEQVAETIASARGKE